ncbi:MAG: hypothetical protein A2X83_04210 [Desulfuromonadales bacterium GWD2_54_10]|nr:MAG: hypothetical protein A2X83_04210 [Desulfuromonadales bacterium GWD2_54_10]
MKLVIVENPRPITIQHYNDVANAPLSASLNSGYALAICREAGWESAYLDFTNSADNARTIAGRILDADADIILFHWVYAWGEEDSVRAVLDLLKTGSAGCIGAFGLFPTLSHQRLAEYAPQLDFILVGEFEATLQELLHTFQNNEGLRPVPGLYQAGHPFMRREVISDLSQLLVPDDLGANCTYSTMNIATSRGCFGDCSFCFINLFYGCQRRRERSIASFERELELRLKRRSINSLYFIDPSFIGYGARQKERVKTISEIAKGYGLPFGFETRVDTIDEHLVSMLANNGATSLFLGIESGCDAALQRINKRITKKQITRAVQCIRNSPITLSVGFIMFEPDTTLDELIENYALLEKLGLLAHHDQTINMLYHSQIVLNGSKAWTKFEQEGRLLLDQKLPFEASYRFANDSVAKVCYAMRRLSVEYFIRIETLYSNRGITDSEQHGCRHSGNPAGVDGSDLNRILKEAFLAFVGYSGQYSAKQFANLEDKFVAELQDCFGAVAPKS